MTSAMTSAREEAIGKILAALPALLVAAAALLSAQAARLDARAAHREDAKTYQNAAITAGDQANELEELRARVRALEERIR